MKLTRKYGGRKYRKHTRKIRARRTKRAKKSKVKRGGAGITSSSIYSHATKPVLAFKSLPAEFPVSTTIKELGGYFPFERLGRK